MVELKDREELTGEERKEAVDDAYVKERVTNNFIRALEHLEQKPSTKDRLGSLDGVVKFSEIWRLLEEDLASVVQIMEENYRKEPTPFPDELICEKVDAELDKVYEAHHAEWLEKWDKEYYPKPTTSDLPTTEH